MKDSCWSAFAATLLSWCWPTASVTDDAGSNRVILPDRVTQVVAEGGSRHHSLPDDARRRRPVYVATVNRPDSRPWMFHIAPRLQSRC